MGEIHGQMGQDVRGGGAPHPPEPSGDDGPEEPPGKTEIAGQQVYLNTDLAGRGFQEPVCPIPARTVGVEGIPEACPVLLQEGAVPGHVVSVYREATGILSWELLGRQENCHAQKDDDSPGNGVREGDGFHGRLLRYREKSGPAAGRE